MRRVIIHGDPGIRKGAIIEYDGQEHVCFGISRQGEWHGPDRVQLWCTVGAKSEFEDFERRNFIPMHLEVDAIDADDVEVVRERGKLPL